MKIFNLDTETEAGLKAYNAHKRTDSPLFHAVEKEFDKWMEHNNSASEYDEMYFGDEAIYTKEGAIIQGIEQIFEVMNEYNLQSIELTDNRLDLECAFQG